MPVKRSYPPQIPAGGFKFDPQHPLAGAFQIGVAPGHSPFTFGNQRTAFSTSTAGAGRPRLTFVGLGPALDTASFATYARSGVLSPLPVMQYPIQLVWVGQMAGTAQRMWGLQGTGTSTADLFELHGGGTSTTDVQGYVSFGTAAVLTVVVPGGTNRNVPLVMVMQSLSRTDHRMCVNGSAVVQSTADAGGTMFAFDKVQIGNHNGNSGNHTALGLFGSGGPPLTDAQMTELSMRPENVWNLLAPLSSPRRVAVATGLTTHTSTGSLVGDGASVAGTSAHQGNHSSSGVLAGDGAATAGVSTRKHIHSASGVLAGDGAATAGVSTRKHIHASTGVLAGAGAATAGVSTRKHIHASTGVLAGAGAATAGVSTRKHIHASTGVLAGAGAATAGVSTRKHIHASTGVLAGVGAATAGVSTRKHIHASTGVLAGVGAATAGGSSRTVPGSSHASSGVMVGAGASLAGVASRKVRLTSVGALVASGASVAGVAARRHIHLSTATLAGIGASVAGTSARRRVHGSTGGLLGTGASIVGTASRVGLSAGGITFDPGTRRIILGSASTSASELWSRWADWAATSDNGKYLPAFRQTGGDDLGGGLLIPPYLFLMNGWRVRPMESNHTLIITGNLFVDGGGVPVVSTLGSFNVSAQYTVPVQAQGITVGGGTGGTGPTSAAIASAVLAALNATYIPVDVRRMNTSAVQGDGSEGNKWRGAGV